MSAKSKDGLAEAKKLINEMERLEQLMANDCEYPTSEQVLEHYGASVAMMKYLCYRLQSQ